jgi:hypothetical protein
MAIYILKNKEKQGPYEESVVAGWLMNGTCAPQDLAWRTGMKEWQPLSAIDLQAKSQFGSSGGILIAILGGCVLAVSIVVFLISQGILSGYRRGLIMNISYEAAHLAETLGVLGFLLGLALLIAGIITAAINKR